jgi:ADP-heptose:LPS heptosyltransferase
MEANGIGDALHGLVAVAGMKRRFPQSQIHYHCRNHEWVKLFDGYDELHQLDHTKGMNLNAGYKEALGKLPCWKRYCLNALPPHGVEGVLPTLKEPDALLQEGEKYRGCTALCIRACYPTRQWPYQHWLDLERLLIDAGETPVIVHNNSAEMMGFRGERLFNKTPRQITSVLLNAKTVIGVESGMCSLASILGKMPYVLCGPSIASKWYFNGAVDVVGSGGIDGRSCCGCWWKSPYSLRCDREGCKALASISPEMVMEKIKIRKNEFLTT